MSQRHIKLPSFGWIVAKLFMAEPGVVAKSDGLLMAALQYVDVPG